MTIHHGDCLEVMAAMEPESVDAICTDPPYDLTGHRWEDFPSRTSKTRQRGGFMGKAWDGTGIAFRPETWAAALRVAKPSAYLLAFGGTRTVHRMAVAIEDAGWIIRDMLVWGYASGFPKSKASLKPAWEPIVMARKPGPLRMLAIDECRIPFESADDRAAAAAIGFGGSMERGTVAEQVSFPTQYDPQTKVDYVAGLAESRGRWPANVILTDPIFDGGVDGVVGGGYQDSPASYKRGPREFEHSAYELPVPEYVNAYGDSGTYSRFFLIPKADRADREPVLGGLPERELRTMGDGAGEWSRHAPGAIQRQNIHPTVKPTDLMRHLVRLVTPSGGTVLDPFLGSGTTGIAAELEGFPWIGIEREVEYVQIAEARLNGTQRGMGLSA